EESAPRHLDAQEEQALVAAGTLAGTIRDRVLIVLLLHTGLRARELCQLRRDQVKLGKRSGSLQIIGKRNKYREVPLNATARNLLEEYLPTLSADMTEPAGRISSYALCGYDRSVPFRQDEVPVIRTRPGVYCQKICRHGQ